MERFKGTEGEWSYHVTGNKTNSYHNIQQGQFGGKTIALLYDAYTSEKETEANAKLISSSPDLLETLIEVDRLLESTNGIVKDSHIHLRIKKTINKALGIIDIN